MKKIILIFLLMFTASVCHAEFVVYFKDHTQRTVTKIEFRGDNADLYLSTGLVMTVPTNSINFEVTGIERPSAAYGITIYGKGKSTAQQQSAKQAEQGPKVVSQEDLKAQWEKSDQVAVATANFGSIRKGDRVKVVASTDMLYTVIAKQEDGTYHKVVLSSENFGESFEIQNAVSNTVPRYVPPPPPQLEPVAKPKTVTPAPKRIAPKLSDELPAISEPTGPRPSLLVPFSVSIALLLLGIGLTLALSRNAASQR